MTNGDQQSQDTAEASIQPSPGGFELAARDALRRNRAVATGLLLVMVLLFIASHAMPGDSFAVQLLRAASEAGIVGGIADWFAVTALFRHPLGLPIPHTAIIARNKDRFGRILGNFVEQNFLTADVVLAKIRQANLAARFAAWLAAPETAHRVAEHVIAALPRIVGALRNRDMQDFVARTIGQQLRTADIAPALGRGLHILSASGEADILFEKGGSLAIDWLNQHKGTLDEIVLKKSRWWVPKSVNLQISHAIVEAATELLDGLRQPDSETRRKFRAALSRLIDELLNSPEQRNRLNAAKDRLLDHPDIRLWTASVWQQFSQALLDDVGHPDSKTRETLEQTIGTIGAALAADPAMQAHIARVLEAAALQLVSWRTEIGGFIAEVVGAWDRQTVSDRVELMIGSDLQYIRINGTLVGAAVGCLLFLGTWLLR